MGLVDRDDGWRMPDWLWEKIEPLLPPPPEHPLGTHKRRAAQAPGDGRDLVGVTHRHAVERARRDWGV